MSNPIKLSIFAPMTKEERQMLCLLRMALWQQDDDGGLLSAETDWHAIRILSEKKAVWGLVAATILRWADLTGTDLPEDVEDACMKGQFNTIQQNQHINKVLAEVQQLLAHEGLSPILLKGQGVARFYPRHELRTAGDIDVFLGSEAQRAAEILMPYAEPDSYRDKSAKHLNLEMKGVELELHRFAINRYKRKTSRVLAQWESRELRIDNSRQVEIDGCAVLVPSQMFELVFVFVHIWLHLMKGGIGLRQLCDWALILHHCHDDIEQEELERLLREADLLRAWQVLGKMLTGLLGLPEQEFPLFSNRYKRAYRLVERMVLESGRFGQNDRKAYAEQHAGKGLLRKWRMLVYTLRIHFRTMALSPRESLAIYSSYYWKRIPYLFKKTPS